MSNLLIATCGKSPSTSNLLLTYFFAAFFNIMLTLTFIIFFRGLFGLNLVTEKDKIICVTEGEFDAMAVH